MSELSQAERTAMEAACRRADLQTRAVRHGWSAARDYGRARERALEEALDDLAAWCAGPLGLEGHPVADSNSHDEPINCLLSVGTLRAGVGALGKARAALTGRPDGDVRRRSMSHVIADLQAQLDAVRLFLPPLLPHESLAQGVDRLRKQRDVWEEQARELQGQSKDDAFSTTSNRRLTPYWRVRAMGEPRRWKMTYRGRRGVEVKRAVSGTEAEWLCQGECVRVREDRVTEADIQIVEKFLDEHEIWLGPKGEMKRDTAIELLGLILGEEASRG